MAEEQAEPMPVARVVAVDGPEAGAVEWKPVARTSGLARTSSAASRMPTNIAVSRALRLSGRSRRTSATPLSMSILTRSVRRASCAYSDPSSGGAGRSTK